MSILNKLKFWQNPEKEIAADLQIPIHECRFVVLDTETTGFDYENDRILCIGALVLQNGIIHVQDGFEHYMDQDIYNSYSAQIHGILRSDVLNHRSELQVLQLLLSYVEGAILVAHHANFDITMINKALERHNLPKLKNKTIDTAVLYKSTLIKSHLFDRKEQYTLDDLADKFDISKKDRHTAMGDAYITAIAFLIILKRLRENKEIVLTDLFT